MYEGDKACFDRHIEDLCEREDIFKGKKQVFSEVFDEAIHDVEPMNELRF